MTYKREKEIKNNIFFKNERHFEMFFPKIKKSVIFLGGKLKKNSQFCIWQLNFPWNRDKQKQAMDP